MMHAWEKCMQTCSLKPEGTPHLRSKRFLFEKKINAIHIQTLDKPSSFEEVEAPRLETIST